MKKITTDATREIIEDFAKEIKRRADSTTAPSKTVIDFRNDRDAGKDGERQIVLVPIELLRYRKDNGRIASDVLSYEKNFGRLDERSDEDQKKIRQFLEEKDKDRTRELKLSIEHDSQREPAIITCDGFLINGNRRKMVLEILNREAGFQKFKVMKVVILPGEGDKGGPPKISEIEQIENRYQLQSDGKAEYYAFDKALSMQRKDKYGMKLEEQLRDDPQYGHLEPKAFERAVEKVRDKFLGPLGCIDRYLETLNREGLYTTISKGLGDPEGRWEAFHDFYQTVRKKLNDPAERLKLKLREDEVGKIEDVAFKLIRKRDFSEIGRKVHMLMREMPSLLGNDAAKRELLKINSVKHELPREKELDAEGKEYDEAAKDKIWGELNREQILRHLNTARMHETSKSERETPINLLEAALGKLEHEKMNPEDVTIFEYERAAGLTREIQKIAHDLEKEFMRLERENKAKLKSKK